MDWWFAFPGGFEAALRGPLAPWAQEIEAAGFVPDETTRRILVSDLDLQVLEVVYGVVAEESTCSSCGAPLRSQVRVVATDDPRTGAQWPASVVTRCCGWRRHRQIAAVVGLDHLELGPLRRPRRSLLTTRERTRDFHGRERRALPSASEASSAPRPHESTYRTTTDPREDAMSVKDPVLVVLIVVVLVLLSAVGVGLTY